jgi:hypothetical protein
LRFEQETPDMTRKKIYAFVGAVALAFALNGCGGGGTTTPAPEPTPTPTPTETAAGNLATAVAAQAALPPGASNEMVRDAAQAVETAAAEYLALLQADAGSSHTEVARVQGLLTAAQTTVRTTTAAINQANALSEAMGKLATAQGTLDGLAADAPAADRKAAAEAVVTAADEYLALLNADPTSAHTEVTRVENAKSTAEGVVRMAQSQIEEEGRNQQAMERLRDARQDVTDAQSTLDGLGADATDEERRDAAQEVVNAANALAMLEDLDSATQALRTSAQTVADTAQAKIDLAGAQATLDGLGASATEEQTRDAAQAVVNAADAYLAYLQAPGSGATHEEVSRVTNARGLANQAYNIAVGNIAAATTLNDAKTDLADARRDLINLPTDATDEQVRDANQAVVNAADVLLLLLDPATTPASEYNDVTEARRMADANAKAAQGRITVATNYATAVEELGMLGADASNEDRLAAQQKVLTAAMALHAVTGTDEMKVTDAQNAVNVTNAMIDYDTAVEELGMLADDASNEDRLAAQQKVLGAATALNELTSTDEMKVTDAQNAVNVTNAMIDYDTAVEELGMLADDASNEDRLAAQQKVLGAATALNELTSTDEMKVTDAQNAVNVTNAMIDYDTAVEELGMLADDASNEDRLAAQEKVLAAATALNELTGTDEMKVTDAQSAVENTKEVIATAAKDMALGVATALMTTATDTDNDNIPDAATITRGTTGDPEITLANANTNALGPTDAEFAVSDDAPAAIMGWSGQMQTRMTEADSTASPAVVDATETVVIYSNKANAKPEKLMYGGTGTAIPTPTALTTVITVAGTETEWSNNFDDEDEMPDTVMGTINGVAGTFTCDAAGTSASTCGVTRIDDSQVENAVSALTGAWAFESTDYHEDSATQDPEHLYFGFWLQDQGDDTFGFLPFSGAGGTELEFDASAAIVGRATYAGAAAGKYVEKTLGIVNGEAEPVSASGGKFTADANLTATFGGAGIPSEQHNKITGSISNFQDEDGNSLSFNVNLKAELATGQTTLGNKFGVIAPENTSLTAAHGNVPSSSGGWSGTFVGATVDDTTTTTVDESTISTPTGIHGIFNAHFNDGDVVGAFAAERTSVTGLPSN